MSGPEMGKTNEGIGTDLYQREIVNAPETMRFRDLTKKVWTPTPYMVDVNDGDKQTWRKILEWCMENFGQESSPIHDMVGDWHRGSVRIYGWTWYGFASEAQLSEFLEAWPQTKPEESDVSNR